MDENNYYQDSMENQIPQSNNNVVEPQQDYYDNNNYYSNNSGNINNSNNGSNNNKKGFSFNKKFIPIFGIVGAIVVLCIIAIIIISTKANNPKIVYSKALYFVKTKYKSNIDKFVGDAVKHDITIDYNINIEKNDIDDTDDIEENYNKNSSNSSSSYYNSGYYSSAVDETNYESSISQSEVLKKYLKGKLNVIWQYDEKYNAQVDTTFENDAFGEVNGSAILDMENKELFYKYKQFKDKWIRADIDIEDFNEETIKEGIDNIKEKNSSFNTKGVDIVIQEVVNELSKKDFEAKNEKMIVNDKEISVRKNTLKLSEKDISDITYAVVKKLRNNEEFLNSVDNREETEKTFDLIIESYGEYSSDVSLSTEKDYEIDLYTTGFFENEIVGISFKYTKDSYRVSIDYRIHNDHYSFIADVEYAGYFTFSIDANIHIIDSNDMKIDIVSVISTRTDVIDVKATIDYKISNDVHMDKVNKNDYIEVKDLTNKDYEDYTKTRASGLISETMLPGYYDNYYYKSSSYIEAHNEEYEAYCGNYVSAANAKALLQKIKTNNTLYIVQENEANNNLTKVYIYVNGNYYDNISDIIKEIKSKDHYRIQVHDYYDNGYIKSIEISIATQE